MLTLNPSLNLSTHWHTARCLHNNIPLVLSLSWQYYQDTVPTCHSKSMRLCAELTAHYFSLKQCCEALHQHNPSIMSWSLEMFLDTLKQTRIRHAIYQQHNTDAGAAPSLCAFCCLGERAKMGVPVKHGTKQNGWQFSSNKNGFVGSKRKNY